MRPCPICESDRPRALPAPLATALVLCRRCGFVYRPDRPTMAALAAAHRAAGGPHYTEVLTLERSSGTMKTRAHGFAVWTRGVLPPRPALLEIASIDTSILAPLRLLLPEARLRAVELADFAGAGGDAPAHEHDGRAWRAAPVAAHAHDAVVLPYSLQRLPDFAAALAMARAALAPGGVLYLEVANLLEPHPDKRLRAWMSSQHFGLFTADKLEALLAATGFTVVRLQADTSLRVLARQAPVRAPRIASEMLRVVRALLWHEARYWPPYVVKRVRQLARARAG